MGLSHADGSMNGSGSIPQASILSVPSLIALRSAVQAHLLDQSSNGDLHRAVRVICDEAHRSDMRAEQLLVAFKQVLASIPEIQQLPSGSVRNDLLDPIVTMCIEEYYAERNTAM